MLAGFCFDCFNGFCFGVGSGGSVVASVGSVVAGVSVVVVGGSTVS